MPLRWSDLFVSIDYDLILGTENFHEFIRGDTHMTSTVRGGGRGIRQKWNLIRRRGWVASVLDVQFFLLKKSGFASWPEIMLIQTVWYYWQEIFLLALVLDSEAILEWYHCFVCELNRTIECVVNLNVTWLGFVFVLILFVHMLGAAVVP